MKHFINHGFLVIGQLTCLITCVVSSDKDCLQLVNDRINVWSPTKKILYTPAKIEEEYGIHPANFFVI
jgi:5'-3' exonuclease